MREQLYARQWVTIESLICAKKPSLLGRFFGGEIISIKRHENSPPRLKLGLDVSTSYFLSGL